MVATKRQQQIRIKVLDIIYTKGPISRIDISHKTGITPATVSEITGQLISEKLIHEIGEEVTSQTKSGRKKILLMISDAHSYYIGIELSEKFFSFVLSDNKGHLIKEKVIAFQSSSEKETWNTNRLMKELNHFIELCREYDPKAIGLALPGHFHKKSYTILTNNSFWEQFNLKELLDNSPLPIYFENNVQSMALAERIFAECHRDQNFAVLHVGRGMFCSCIYNGELYGKNNVLVGEIGHTISHPDGELCECGKRGCLQTYASEAWIIKKSQILYQNSDNTYLRQLADTPFDITIETILRAYALGDEGVITILHNAIKYLSIAINNISMMIDTKTMIIHGQLFDEPQLVALLKEHSDRHVTILATERKLEIDIKPYSTINGALAACGLCVQKTLLTA